MRNGFFRLSIVAAALALPAANAVADTSWQQLEQGLQFGRFHAPRKSKLDEHTVVMLRIDPAFFAFHLLSASEHDERPRSLKAWCEEFGLRAATNASMYLRDAPLKSTGYLKNRSHVNNARINQAFGAFLVFNPKASGIPDVDIVDRRVQPDWERTIGRYDTVIQNYRMVSYAEPVEGWPRQEKIYGTAAIGIDAGGRVLFILSHSPVSTYDFIRILTGLPIALRHAVYAEGGQEAALYLNHKMREGDGPGGPEAGFVESDVNIYGWRIPNVVGIRKK